MRVFIPAKEFDKLEGTKSWRVLSFQLWILLSRYGLLCRPLTRKERDAIVVSEAAEDESPGATMATLICMMLAPQADVHIDDDDDGMKIFQDADAAWILDKNEVILEHLQRKQINLRKLPKNRGKEKTS